MRKLMEIETNPNVLVSSTVYPFISNDIYLPILPNSELYGKKGAKVNIGSPILKSGEKVVTSSISGVISDIVRVSTINGELDAVKITNDFKEKKNIETTAKRNIKTIRKDILSSILLSNYGLQFQEKKDFVLNAIDDEPYVLSEAFVLYNYYEELLELLDTLAYKYHFRRVYIAVKSTSSGSISGLLNILGMYPNIGLTIVPNFYLLGNSKFLAKHLELEKDAYVLKASYLYQIYNLLKRNKIKSSKFITVSGDNVENPRVVKVKIGTSVSELLKDFKLLDKNTDFILNGLLTGKKIEKGNFVITEDIDSILIMKKKEPKKEMACTHCGACIDACPVGLYPCYFDKVNYLKKAKETCAHCGLCSYICPSNINFKEKDGV